MAELKTKENSWSVTDLLNSIQSEQQRNDCFVILEMMKKVSNETPMMWWESIIGFWKYTYTYSSWRTWDWMRIAFSPRKNYISIYIMPELEPFNWLLEKLGKHKTWRSCLYIRKLSNVDLNILEEILIKGYKRILELYP